MVIMTITSFATSLPTDSTISQLGKAINILSSHPQFTIGTKVQDPTTIQITAEWPSIQSPSDLITSSAYQAFTTAISGLASSHLETAVVKLNKSIFAAGNPPLIEFVKSDFPSSSIPELQTKIEDDFARFEAIYCRRGSLDERGEIGLATGWAEEKDGVRAFVVVRGWREMQRFEKSLQSEEFKEGIPILMGWGIPFELWHVDEKVGSEVL
ncbi:hypothetical protein E8E12_011186 [Didymella heteroderae]|uniref:ABM domain-containing protein n=1 Tax=Didymella heteroderae TaxID=1769908 RepID=A0A9P4WYK9_9PLEO|nr:hypothetical protein E8E12_011186 [Didymella heteroderae]